MNQIISQIRSLHKLGRNDLSRSLELQNIYYSLVEMIVQSKYQEIADALNELRSPEFSEQHEVEAIRRFITIRLSMKRGDPGEDISWINFPIKEDSWFAAEKYLVLGHWNYYLKQFAEGIESFKKAELKFRSLEMHGREFVSAFNAIIGEVSGPIDLAPLQQLEKLRSLELRVLPFIEKKDCGRVQAMVYRQKAHAFEDLDRLHASLEEISKAIAIFELHGPISDYQLALLHAADICLDLGETFKSKTYVDYIFPPIDARVEFPLAFVSWRLGGPIPEKSNFSILPGGWKEKFEKLNVVKDSKSDEERYFWNQQTGELREMVIKPSSLEGRLIRLLTQEKATKNLLIETLWPLQGEVHLLDNRLHRLISRLNKKLNDAIAYDGKFYTLKIQIIAQ